MNDYNNNRLMRSPSPLFTPVLRLARSRNSARAIVAAAVVAIGGCGGASELLWGSRTDYRNTAKSPSLEVPPDLTRPGRDDRYVVPEPAAPGVTSATLSTYNAERATAAGRTSNAEVLPTNDQVRVERSGSERWLVINLDAEKVWPTVRQFWVDNGFALRVENPATGVIETDWNEKRARFSDDGIRSLLTRAIGTLYSTGERDLFRTRLERSADGKSTEVYVSHRGMTEQIVTNRLGNEGTVWQPRDPDPHLEAEFLRRLMVRFGVQEARAQAQLPSPAAPPERAKLVSNADGPNAIVLDEPFDRAWRRVGVVLDRSGFTVEDRDRSKGFYFVRYADPRDDQPQERPGLFSRIFGLGDGRQISAEQYRVLVQSASSDSSQIQVLNRAGAAENSSTTKRILNVLHSQLK